MNDERIRHGERFDDIGFMRLVKMVISILPLILLIFSAGGWYQSSKANAILADKLQLKTEDHEKRITQVEDAVKYLAQIVKDDRRSRE